MSDDALKQRLTDYLCEVPFPRFMQSQGVIKIVADDLAGWLAVFISYETKSLTAVAEAARTYYDITDPGYYESEHCALGVALDALDGRH